MDSNRVNDHYNLPKSLTFNLKTTTNPSAENEEKKPDMNNKDDGDINENNSTEEFWEDAKDNKDNASSFSIEKKSDKLDYAIRKFSSNGFKKNKYENSLAKAVDFDDLITGGKILKNENDSMNLCTDTDYLTTQNNHNHYNISEPNFPRGEKISNHNESNLTQPCELNESKDNTVRVSSYDKSEKVNSSKGYARVMSDLQAKVTSSYNLPKAKVGVSRNVAKSPIGYNSFRLNQSNISEGKPQDNKSKKPQNGVHKQRYHSQDNKCSVRSNAKNIPRAGNISSLPKKVGALNKSPVNKKASLPPTTSRVNKKVTSLNVVAHASVSPRPMINITERSGKIKPTTPELKPTTFHRLNSLYNKGKEKDAKIQKKREENQKLSKVKELEGCTFKPKINNKFTPVRKSVLNSRNEMSIYERQQLWHNKKNEKIEREKNLTKIQENMDCTFAPTITKNIPVNYLQASRVYIDKQTKKYYERVNKAKIIKEEINSKLNPDYNELYDKLVKAKAKKEQEITVIETEEYGTFNPNKETKVDYNVAKFNLRSQLHAFNIETDN